MTEIEVLTDLLREFVKSARREIEGLSGEALAWKPDVEANSIGLTVWHVARWMDVLGTRILQDDKPEMEQWHVRGWRERAGYDPRGIGFEGLGAITGYSLQEAAAVPKMSGEDLQAYLDQAYAVVEKRLGEMPVGALYEPTAGMGGKRTVYEWLKVLIRGFFGHIGEIQALKAMRMRNEALRSGELE